MSKELKPELTRKGKPRRRAPNHALAEPTADIHSRAELAKRLGWTRRLVESRAEEPDWPITTPPPWPHWVADLIRAKYGEATGWARRKAATADTPESKARVLKLEHETALLRLRVLEQEGKTIIRSEVHDIMMRLAALLRRCGEQLRRTFGNDPADLLEDTLGDFEREVKANLNGET